MRDEFWEIMDDFEPFLGMMFAFSVVLLVLLVLTFPVLEPGTGSYYISILSFVILSVTLVAVVYVIRKTKSYTRD